MAGCCRRRPGQNQAERQASRIPKVAGPRAEPAIRLRPARINSGNVRRDGSRLLRLRSIFKDAHERVGGAATSSTIFPVRLNFRRLLDQLIRALDSVKAVADDSCTNSTRTAAAPKQINITAKHATMKTRTIFLQLPQQIQRTCPDAGSVKALVSISTTVRPTAPTRA